MTATIHKLPTAAKKPVIQHGQSDLYRMAELVAARAVRMGVDCSVDEAFAACRASIAEVTTRRGFPQR